MKKLRMILIIMMIINLVSCTSDKGSQISEEDNIKEGLVEALDKFNQAFQEGSTATLESMITENYIHSNGNSKSIGKKKWLSYLGKRENEIKTGDLIITNYEMVDREIVYHSKMAIVTGKVLVSSKKKDEVNDNEYRVTNIWVYESGAWKRAGFHDGKIK